MNSIDEVRQRAEIDAKTHGYHLTSDPEMLKYLLEGLKTNEDRYSYPSCPCRMATGIFEVDRDIICPCDYRDPDVLEYGACYCNLYVNTKTYESRELKIVPERRPLIKKNRAAKNIGKKREKEEKQVTQARANS
jgi:ferredoxin-thioredoxin reductase catalytic subunit